MEFDHDMKLFCAALAVALADLRRRRRRQKPRFYSDDPIARVADTAGCLEGRARSRSTSSTTRRRNLFGNPGDPEHEPAGA